MYRVLQKWNTYLKNDLYHYRLKFANVNVIDHQDNFCQSNHINKDKLYMHEFFIVIYLMQSFAYTLIYTSNILKRTIYYSIYISLNG